MSLSERSFTRKLAFILLQRPSEKELFQLHFAGLVTSAEKLSLDDLGKWDLSMWVKSRSWQVSYTTIDLVWERNDIFSKIFVL